LNAVFHEYDAGAKSLAGHIQTEVIEKSSNFGIARNGSHARWEEAVLFSQATTMTWLPSCG